MAAQALVDELAELSDHESLLLKSSIDALVRDTPQTQVAIVRFKKYGAKAERSFASAARDVLVDMVNVVDDPYDRRLSNYSFIWRGLAASSQLKELKRELSRRAPDIELALRNGNREDLQWHLAALVSQSAEARRQIRNRRQQLLVVFFATLIIYALAAAVFRQNSARR